MLKSNYFYISLIILIWAIAYLACTLVWNQQLAWDETSYLSTARGIAVENDISSRFFTVLGLIKYGYPQHTHHYPLYPIYIAVFFKLFGVSLHVAYLSSWLCGLITSIFIYLTMPFVTKSSKFFSFLVAISFAFLPRVFNNCDSAMMEVPGCALLMIFTYFVFKDLSNGKINPFLMGISAACLYLFKALFINVVIGFLFLMLFGYKEKFFGLKVNSRFPLFLNVLVYLATFLLICFIFIKFVFLPLAPMVNLDRRAEISGDYAEPLGGFLKDPIGNAIINTQGFIERVFSHYFPSFPVILLEEVEGFFGVITPAWIELGLFYLVVFYVIGLLVFEWKKLLPENKIFILYSLLVVFIFNFIFNLVVTSSLGQRTRHNTTFVPLILISAASFLKPGIINYNFRKLFLIVSFTILVYFPYFISTIRCEEWSKSSYYEKLHKNSEIVKRFIGNEKPMFIYFNTSTHTTWDSFPTRVIVQEATNHELKALNIKLPKPIEYLFLNTPDKLFVESQDLILKREAILDGQYIFHGFDEVSNVYVYKLNR